MGYQESFIGGSPAKFNKLKDIVIENGVEYYEDEGVYVNLIVTLKKDTPTLGKIGDQFLYVCGERYPQSYLSRFLNEKECEGIRIVFSEELPDDVSKYGYEEDKIYPDMETKYFSVKLFDFE